MEMLFPFAADVDADLLLCALYFEVSIPASTSVVLIHLHLLTVSRDSFVRLRVTNKKTVLHHLEEHLYVSDIAEHPLLYKDLHLVYRD